MAQFHKENPEATAGAIAKQNIYCMNNTRDSIVDVCTPFESLATVHILKDTTKKCNLT
jgi:hypothetical protein